MTNQSRRFIQIYTGNGKGKTTAALGQAVRAAGCGLKTFIIMFMKDYPYSEINCLKLLDKWITVERYGNDDFVYKKQLPPQPELDIAQNALQKAREVMLSGKYDIIILDEICVTTYFKLLAPEDVLPLLRDKPDSVELILTGRYCPQEWLDRADLVTEMQEIKHYYKQGVPARQGFES